LRSRLAALGLVLLVAVCATGARGGRPPRAASGPRSVQEADALAGVLPGRDRDRALAQWAERAGLPDLLFVLRRPAAELAGAEAPLVETALARTHPARRALQARLLTRLALADPDGAARRFGALAPRVAELPRHPRASVFRVGALLPDRGDYAGFGRSVRLGIEAALAEADSAEDRSLTLRTWSTGEGDPAGVAAALDSALDSSALLVGELLSVPTLEIASAARAEGVPLISPTATDEAVGSAGPAVFQIGPSGARRAIELARSWLDDPPSRVGVLVTTDAARGTFGQRFASAAEAFGFQVVWRETYPPDTQDFRALVRAMSAKKVDLLFWDGEPREADALIKQLVKDRMSVRLCGGEGLAPEQHHAEIRPLMEGVRYIVEDWRFPAPLEARLDSLARAAGEDRAGTLFVRGFLAGRFLAAAVRGGAMCPEEVTSFLTAWLEHDPGAPARGFLNCPAEGATLPVFTIARGKAVPLP
jgi:ABC-type branched-subunit amino acid transport system substrate-binding protein